MSDELKTIIEIAKAAGKIHLKYFGSTMDVAYKQDEFDPVTQADKESDDYIRTEIEKAFPGDKILSEENEAQPSDYTGRVWMVDPLDGTKDFIAGRGNCFATIIGLLEEGVPVLGVVYAPVQGELFYAQKGHGAFHVLQGITQPLKVSAVSNLRVSTLIVRNIIEGDVRPLDPQINALQVGRTIPEGSIGLKMGRIAQGLGDVFVNTTQKACKWDTLGSQVLLTEAGGVVADLEGKPLDYAKSTVNWDKYFVAANSTSMLEQVLAQVILPS